MSKVEEAAETSVLQIPVEGMTCASCVQRVERAIGKVDGVESVDVNLATNKATVRSKNGMPAKTIIDVVTGGGYDVALTRSEEHTSDLQSRGHLVCRLL